MAVKDESSTSERNESISEQQINHAQQSDFTLYKSRWLMVTLLAACYCCMSFQFLQFSIIANIAVEFYDVSYEAVNWTALILLVLFPPFLIPVLLIMNKITIHTSLIITIVAMCASSWIKVAAANPGRFWLVMIGQVFIAASQVFISVLPARVASAWFGVKETALACGIAIFGFQLGVTLGCYVPTVMVGYSADKDAVAHDLTVLTVGFAIICTVVSILTFALFKSQPPTPPSGSQQELETIGKVQFEKSTVLLFKDPSYILFLIAFAISIAIFYAVPTLLNQIVLHYYPDSLEEVGIIGLLLNIMGVFSSAVSGYILGKLQRYRATTIGTFALYLLGMILFTIAPYYSIVAVYVATLLLGFFMTSTYTVCLEVAAELTYPVPESTSSGYLIASSQLAGVALTYLYSFLLYTFSAFWSNVITCILLLVSMILISCMKFNRKRQFAEELHKKEQQTKTF